MLTDNQYYLMNMTLNHLGDIPDHPDDAYLGQISGIRDSVLIELLRDWRADLPNVTNAHAVRDNNIEELMIEALGPDNEAWPSIWPDMLEAAPHDALLLGTLTQRLLASYAEQIIKAHVNEWHNKVLARESLARIYE